MEDAGVTRPPDVLDPKGVTHGVTRPEYMGVARPPDGKEGVIRPRDDATDDGRETVPTVGGDNFAIETKTPHLGGHLK